MALVYSKDKEFHIHLKENDVGRYVILPGDPGRCEKIAEYFDNAVKVASNREYVTYTGYIDSERVSVVSTGIGGPSASIAVEELIHVGADTFIRVGTSGGIQPEILGGDLVIATGAIRNEGTTKEYVPVEYPAVANYEIVNALKEAADNLGFKSHIGVVHCKDNFYAQHSPETMPISNNLKYSWQAYKMAGALASEMESAAIFVVGSVRRVRTGTVLTVLANQTRREMGLEDIQVNDSKKSIETAIEAIRILIKEDKSNKDKSEK